MIRAVDGGQPCGVRIRSIDEGEVLVAGQLFSAIFVIVVGVGGCVAYFWGANRLIDVVFPSRGVSGAAAIDNLRRQGVIRPWLFVGPALIILVIYLIYPVIDTIWLTFHDRAGENFVGLANYEWAFGDREFRNSILNTVLWLAVVPAACPFLGLVIAVLTDRIWWGTIAKSLIFLPLANSFVGAIVIWRLIYEYRGEGQTQIGILYAIIQGLGAQPQIWISLPFWNNFFLMIILIWIQTGFATVILAAALRGIPEDTLEAAVIDGAGPFKIFYRIMVPQIASTILVVWTTITVLVLKVF